MNKSDELGWRYLLADVDELDRVLMGILMWESLLEEVDYEEDNWMSYGKLWS